MSLHESSDAPLDLAGMRVLQVLATTTGGTGAHVAMLVEHLVRRGANVIVSGPAATERSFRFGSRGARFVPVPIGALPHPHDVLTLRRLRLLARRADIVHAHSLRAAAVAGVAVPRPVPFVVTRHNAILVTGAVRALHEALQLYTARRAHVTLCVSGDLLEAVRRAGGTDVRRTFVTAPALPPPRRDRDSVRRELGADNRPLVLSVGRLHEQKDYPTLIEAARRLQDLDPQPLFVIAGDGPQRADLQQLVATTTAPVRLLGERDDLADLLAAADALALSSVWEGSPLSVQEGLRSGLPFVGTRVGSIPDIVAGAGLLVPPRDPRALSVQLRRVLTEPALVRDLRRRAVRRATELPSDDDVVDQVMAAYAGARAAVTTADGW